MVIEYKPPTPELRDQIWRNLINKFNEDQNRLKASKALRKEEGKGLPEEQAVITLREGFEGLAKGFTHRHLRMNGRDIRKGKALPQVPTQAC